MVEKPETAGGGGASDERLMLEFAQGSEAAFAELESTLREMRGLGKVMEEKQSGEDVSEQHEDLEARLRAARITEARFEDILSGRTGSVADVLEVEQEMERVRGEIEQMEAEEKGLNERVVYSSVDVVLDQTAAVEAEPGAGAQMRRAMGVGLRRAGDSLLGLVLFVEENGLTLAFWGGVVGMVTWLGWRRYRRMRG
jgi:hypothetical protein